MNKVDVLEKLKDQLYEMEGRMKTLAWDDQKKQINPYKKQQLEAMLKEKERLLQRINQLEAKKGNQFE